MKRNKTIKCRRSAEVSKPAIIAVIAVLAVLALSLLIFFSGKFVGKAIQATTITKGNVGIFVSGFEEVGKEFSVPIMVYLPDGKQSTVVSFELSYDKEVLTPNCDILDVALDDLYGSYKVLEEQECQNGIISFKYAFLPFEKDGQLQVIKGQQKIGEILFKALKEANSTKLTFKSFDVYDLDTGKLMEGLTIKNAIITITAKQGKVCFSPTSECNGQCVNLQTDKNNCGKCGKKCGSAEICEAGICKAPVQPATCNDNIKNQNEGDVDCGGVCPTKCAADKSCNSDEDCDSNDCEAGVCKAPVVLPECGDNERNRPTEECDGADLITEECEVLDSTLYESGELSCAEDCTFDTSSCVLKPTTILKGKKITLIEVSPVNNLFSTKIIADEGFTQGVMVYTVLYDSDNVVLSWKYDWIKSGVFSEKGKTYTAKVSYDQSDVKKKVVIAFDKEGPGQQVYGTLPQDYP